MFRRHRRRRRVIVVVCVGGILFRCISSFFFFFFFNVVVVIVIVVLRFALLRRLLRGGDAAILLKLDRFDGAEFATAHAQLLARRRRRQPAHLDSKPFASFSGAGAAQGTREDVSAIDLSTLCSQESILLRQFVQRQHHVDVPNDDAPRQSTIVRQSKATRVNETTYEKFFQRRFSQPDEPPSGRHVPPAS
jgi:hypothetical protein